MDSSDFITYVYHSSKVNKRLFLKGLGKIKSKNLYYGIIRDNSSKSYAYYMIKGTGLKRKWMYVASHSLVSKNFSSYTIPDALFRIDNKFQFCADDAYHKIDDIDSCMNFYMVDGVLRMNPTYYVSQKSHICAYTYISQRYKSYYFWNPVIINALK